MRYSSRDGHAKGEHVNRERERDIPSFCPTLQVLDMSTLGDAAIVIELLCYTFCNIWRSTAVTASTLWPTMPHDLPRQRRRIVEAVAAIDRQILQCVWQELDYRIDICDVTKGGHIEHL
jgi:hypothetical protein